MLFDLEPYLSFNAFVVLWVLAAVAVAGYLVDRDNRDHDNRN